MAVVEIRSDVWRTCEVCHTGVGSTSMMEDPTERVNHAIEEHGAKLLHVGQETTNYDGEPGQAKVFVLRIEGSLPEEPTSPLFD